ncbi:hypothetical protein FBUS_09065 [Fasciolopsis buskii]|uniref:Uncharacterized protein n=1 Tax=Fasciolopsis buskii TaxID=27845 RepID=A0A8E0S044_9TREM|nr:hypothetical protein FBUS_09065 [Fasciolopsis buski]
MNPSCFVSLNLNTIRLSYYSSERLRQKNIQDHKRPRINHHSTEQEPCMPIQTNSINLRAKPLIGYCFVSLNLNTIRLSYYSSERLRQKNIQDHKRPRINHHSTEQEPCMPIQTNSINLRAKPLIG